MTLQKTDLSLTAAPARKYSNREMAVFKFLAKMYPEACTTKQIADSVIDLKDSYFAQTSTVTAVKHLQKKMAFNSEKLTLLINNPGGPRPMTVALIERGNNE